jgi:tetratricopeptide (TPR) repeat protein
VGGRALTILTLFLVTFYTLSGYGYEIGRPTFGFGFDPGDFAFEAADYLKTSKISGEVMNLSESHGDALIYRAYPTRKGFIDRRNHVFGPDIRNDLREFGRAFSVERTAAPTGDQEGPEPSADEAFVLKAKDDPAKWAPILDKYRVSAVLISPEDSLIIYGVMLTSKNWILLHHDGRAVLFGRADAPEADLALFQKEKLDADELVYKRKQRVPFPDRSPTPMSFIDGIIRNRSLANPQPHVSVGEYWISAGETVENRGLTPAANALLAVREARKAIHFNPDSSYAYRLLDRAYEKLSQNEFAVFDAKAVAVPAGLFNFRARQRITALNYAIQTTPPPRDANEKLVLADSYIRLALIHRRTGEVDLERDALAAARDLMPFRLEDTKRLDQLDDSIARFKDDLQKAPAERNLSEPIARANYAINAGFPGIAIHELEEAENTGVPLDQFLSMLVNLYCRTGQPEKANEKLTNRPLEDPALFGGPGTPAYTHGLVNFLMGYYDNTIVFWRDNALGQALFTEKSQELEVARDILRGVPENAVSAAIDVTGIPGKPGLIESESTWEFELALCLLEAGDPDLAGQRFLRCLKFNPKIVVRPLIEYYLEKLKLPIPPLSTDGGPKPEAQPEPKAEVPKPDAKAEPVK